MENTIKIIGAGFTAIVTYLFGGVDLVLTILLAFIVIDFLTGLLAGIYNKVLSSEIGYKGIAKKIGILAIVAVAHLISTGVGTPEIRSLVIGFYIANEGISILENVGRTGVPLPKKLVDILKQLKEGEKDGD